MAAEDIPIFFEFQLDPEASRLAGFPIRSWDAFSIHWSRILDDETIVARTIVVDGQVAGNVVSFVQDDSREVGYWLGRPFWGRGIATTALSQFLAHEQRRPLFAYVARHNLASLRVLEKTGFTFVSEGQEGYRLGLSE